LRARGDAIFFVSVALGIALVALALVPYRSIEFVARDEAVYAVFAQRAQHGAVCFRDFWDVHFPGLYYVYAWAFEWSARAGDGAKPMEAVRTLHLLTQAGVLALFGGLARSVAGAWAASLAVAALACAAISPAFEGATANTEPFALLFVCAGLWLARAELAPRVRDLAAGALIALGSLFKQNAAFFLVVPILADGRRGWARAPWLFAGWLVPNLIVGLSFARVGAFDEMLEQTVLFPLLRRAGGVGAEEAIRGALSLVGILVHGHPALAAGGVAAVALAVALAISPAVSPTPRAGRWIVAFLAVGLAVSFAGLRSLGHYLQFAAPALALALGWAVVRLSAEPIARAGALALTALLAVDVGETVLRTASAYVGEYTPTTEHPRWREAEVGEYVKSRTGPSDSILVWGPKPAVFYYADRPAPGRFYGLYPLVGPNTGRRAQMDIPGAMDELRASLESSPPRYVVLAPTLANYALDQAQFVWLQRWIDERYLIEATIGEYDLLRRR